MTINESDLEAIRRVVRAELETVHSQRETSRRSFYAGLKQHVIAPAIAFLDRWFGGGK